MNSIKSEFTNRAFLIPISIIAFIAIPFPFLISSLPSDLGALRWIDYYLVCLFTYMICWLVLGELRQKMIIVKIENNRISKRNFLGQKEEHEFSAFEGHETSTIPSKNGTYEHLYLIQNGKRKIKISEQYHRNYHDLKSAISEKSKFLGKVNFSFWKEMKEVFSF